MEWASLPRNKYLFECYFNTPKYKELVVSIIRLSPPSTWQNKYYGSILLNETAVFAVKKVDHYGNYRCLIEKNVPIAFILPGRWRDGGESLGIET